MSHFQLVFKSRGIQPRLDFLCIGMPSHLVGNHPASVSLPNYLTVATSAPFMHLASRICQPDPLNLWKPTCDAYPHLPPNKIRPVDMDLRPRGIRMNLPDNTSYIQHKPIYLPLVRTLAHRGVGFGNITDRASRIYPLEHKIRPTRECDRTQTWYHPSMHATAALFVITV